MRVVLKVSMGEYVCGVIAGTSGAVGDAACRRVSRRLAHTCQRRGGLGVSGS